ncbi:MAG TPA: helicase-related protein, partial [Phycisphaerae bacterium]|nr:helicase-related protein [Phycisphaerae bacterium]
IADECHWIPQDGEGMYRQFIGEMRVINPQVRIIGFTATPYRLRGGLLCAPDHVLNAICYEIGVRELIVQGYLCPLRSKAGSQNPDYDQLHVRGGEFIPGEVEQAMDSNELVVAACQEIVQFTAERKAVLIFAAGVQHGEHVVRTLRERHQVECGFVCGDTLPFVREETIQRFRAGELKYLANVNVLTTGFDAPHIDCVALLRPTMSPGLYYQMVGRGFRLHPGKTDCLVLDFGGNILRHGPVDQIRIDTPTTRTGPPPAKECPQCHELIAAGYAVCPQCGHLFPPPEREKHDRTASTEGVLSDEVQRNEYDVADVFYAEHVKRGAPPDAPHTLRVDYKIGFNTYVSEWICFEHEGWPRRKAEDWWRLRGAEPVPDTAGEAAQRAQAGELAVAERITVERRAGDQFDRVVAYVLGDKPTALHEHPWDDDQRPTAAGEACPGCQRYDVTIRRESDDCNWEVVCAWCGRWLRSASDHEAHTLIPIDDIPF